MGNIMEKRIVKKSNHTEGYQRHKLINSVKASCLGVHDFVGSAELTAKRVCEHVEQWLESKHEVTSADIRRIAGKSLFKYNPDAAYIYITINEIN